MIYYASLPKKYENGKKKYMSRPLKSITVKQRKVSELLKEMSNTGFQGKKLGEVADIYTDMLKERDLTIFLGYAGSMSTTGQWKIIRWLIENRYIDVLVSTGANISEDIFEAMGNKYYQGTWVVDDQELLKLKIDRFYDVYADEYDYRKLENLIQEFAKGLDEKEIYSTRRFLHLFGEFLYKKNINSILAAAYKHKVPVYSPGLIDSGYGVALSLLKKDGKTINLDQTRDMEEMARIAEVSKKTGVIYIGGGVPKDTIQLATVIKSLATNDGNSETPHDYAIQITTDSPQWGGLSGCTFEEAVSWGKINSNGRNAVLYCDATIALPIVSHALAERVKARNRAPDLSWVFKE